MDELILKLNNAMREHETVLFGQEPDKKLYTSTDLSLTLINATVLIQASTRHINFLEKRIIPGVNSNEYK